MSCIEIIKFDITGKAQVYAEIKNALLGSFSVWSILGKKYFGYDINFIKPSCIQKVWDLYSNSNIPVNERIVLGSTFDNCLIKKENIPNLINAYTNFKGNTNLTEQANILMELYNHEDCIAVGFHQSSVSCCQWYTYNCLKQNEHFYLFEDIVF